MPLSRKKTFTTLRVSKATNKALCVLAVLTRRTVDEALDDLARLPVEAALQRHGLTPADRPRLLRLARQSHRSKHPVTDQTEPRTTLKASAGLALAVRVLSILDGKTVTEVLDDLCGTATDDELKARGIDPQAVRKCAEK